MILSQHAVAAKSNEIKAVPTLLQGRDLRQVVITGDALLTQRALAQQILDQGGHYLMVVKRNQPDCMTTSRHSLPKRTGEAMRIG